MILVKYDRPRVVAKIPYTCNRLIVDLWILGSSDFCKVEFNQPSCWFYFVPNLLVIQHLETLYLGGNHVRVVSERV